MGPSRCAVSHYLTSDYHTPASHLACTKCVRFRLAWACKYLLRVCHLLHVSAKWHQQCLVHLRRDAAAMFGVSSMTEPCLMLPAAAGEGPPPEQCIPMRLAAGLRYGENPHQPAAFYTDRQVVSRAGSSAHKLRERSHALRLVADMTSSRIW